MSKPWVKTIRRETGLIENICEHGVGHPAIGSVMWLEKNGHECMGVHGCCECCRTPEWRLADALEGLRIATDLLFGVKKEVQRLRGLQEEHMRGVLERNLRD